MRGKAHRGRLLRWVAGGWLLHAPPGTPGSVQPGVEGQNPPPARGSLFGEALSLHEITSAGGRRETGGNSHQINYL